MPEGSRAYAGIGCHYMSQWMERKTEGFTHMGGEGANWIGEAPFSKRGHVFQNLGDGTYLHSGSLAIRAAVASGINMTYKLLYNDAVAMTGGQQLDGGLTPWQMAAQVKAEGARKVVVVTDDPGKYDKGLFPSGTEFFHRRDLQSVQMDLAKIEGITALIYDQTCAAEKRRRRKRGTFPDPVKRAFINPAVCEGCGDCSKASNCVAIVPLETDLGRKRAIDQSTCNKDFSCVNGFCPSFVTVHGATPKKRKAAAGTGALDELLGALAGSTPARAGQALQHPRHRRRRHGCGDDLGRARPGGPPRRQGLWRHRHDRPCPEGRRRDVPHAHRRASPTTSTPSASAPRRPISSSAATSSSPRRTRCSTASGRITPRSSIRTTR